MLSTELRDRANSFITTVEQLEIENKAAIKSKAALEKTILELEKRNENNKEAHEIAQNAIVILRQVSDRAVGQAYRFLEKSLNAALARMFADTIRKVELKEYVVRNQYPQLEIILHVGNGKTRSLKADSGHGIAQIVSLLSILSLIVITGSRRILVMDEILSGISEKNRQVVSDILWTFAEIGFQFIIVEHGFIPDGAHVYKLKMSGNVSSVEKDYIQPGKKPEFSVYEAEVNENAFDDGTEAVRVGSLVGADIDEESDTVVSF